MDDLYNERKMRLQYNLMRADWYFHNVFLKEDFNDWMKWKKANMVFECLIYEKMRKQNEK